MISGFWKKSMLNKLYDKKEFCKMKRIISVLLAACMAISLAACGGEKTPSSNAGTGSTSNSYEKMNLRINFSGTDQGIDGLVAAYMKDELNKRSGGMITLDTFSNCQLSGGDMNRQVEMLIAGGTYELGIISDPLLAAVDDRLQVTNIPFAFSSYEEAYQYADSTGGEYNTQVMAENGIKLLGIFSNGILQITNNKHEVTSPDDLKDIKLRVSGKLNTDSIKEMGGDGVSVTFSELYSALQMGTVDGQINGYQTIQSASIDEVQSYLTECNMQWVPYSIVAGSGEWEKISDANKELIAEVAKDAAQYGRDYMNEVEGSIKQEFIDNGMTITELTEEQLGAFEAACENTIKDAKTLVGEDACVAWGIES